MARTRATEGGTQGQRSSTALRALPTEAQRRYLARSLSEPGRKLPLFDRDGRAIPRKTVEACIAQGWAERWFGNPLKPDWLVCRLTPDGFRVLGQPMPDRPSDGAT